MRRAASVNGESYWVHAAKHILVIVFACLTMARSAGGFEPDPVGYERILLPVVVQSRPGAFGSRWVTEVVVRNASDEHAHVFQQECVFFCTCVGITCATGDAPPHTTFRTTFQPAGQTPNVGAFLYVNKRLAETFVVQARVRDISRNAESWGTEVPAIRDRDMRTSTTHLLEIPLSEGFRHHLRLYGASAPSGEGVLLVRAFAGRGNDLLAERVMILQPATIHFGEVPPRLPADHELPAVPAYAEISSLRDLVGVAHDTIRLEIVPVTPGLKFWGMVSVTNNVTQHVTLVTPQ